MTRNSTYIGTNRINVDAQLFATLLLQSFNYCLGSMTYAVSVCVENLIRYWYLLPPAWQDQIHRDIRRAIETESAGMDMDIKQWEKILTLPPKDDPK